MLVIPAINEVEFLEVLKKIKIAEKFSSWVHLDIVDGKFAKNKTWNKPKEIPNSKFQIPNFEVHLMVENPGAVIKNWVKAGAKRIIVHLEALHNANLRMYANAAKDFELGLAINPETPVEKLIPFISINQPKISINQRCCKFVQILAVKPGLAGQQFDKKVLEKIKFLKKHYPDVIIEVDGGLNLETAKLAKEAGTDIIVSASYIWGSSNPQKAYLELSSI